MDEDDSHKSLEQITEAMKEGAEDSFLDTSHNIPMSKHKKGIKLQSVCILLLIMKLNSNA